MAKLTFAQVDMILKADFETGQLFWRERTPDMFKDGEQSATHNCTAWNRKHAGKEVQAAGSSCRYDRVSLFRIRHYKHRVIWLLAHKEWPPNHIDHINGNTRDNRLSNLRAVSQNENNKNMAKPKTNTSGHVGVYWHKQRSKWMAYIQINKRPTNLGLYANFEDAVRARKEAELKHGFHPNHGR